MLLTPDGDFLLDFLLLFFAAWLLLVDDGTIGSTDGLVVFAETVWVGLLPPPCFLLDLMFDLVIELGILVFWRSKDDLLSFKSSKVELSVVVEEASSRSVRDFFRCCC